MKIFLADALSRRPDQDPRTTLIRQVTDDDEDNDRCVTCESFQKIRVTAVLSLFNELVAAYENHPDYADIIAYLGAHSQFTLGALSQTKRDNIQHYRLEGNMLLYSIEHFDFPRADDMDLRPRIIH